MFEQKDSVITKVLNPMGITKSSAIEFNIGKLKDTGLYRFKKIIQFDFSDKSFSRYILYSVLEDREYILEVVPGGNQGKEVYIYELTNTIPFSEEFLDVAGQKYLTTPEGDEYQRCIMPDDEERIEGLSAGVKIYGIENDQIEKEMRVKIWDYSREDNGQTEFLNVEMSEENGMFRVFRGEIIEDIFYKFYEYSKQ